MKKEAEANADADAKLKEEVEKINGADTLIFQTEKSLKEAGDKIPADKKAPIEAALVELKSAHESKDITLIDAAMAKMNELMHAFSEELYKAQQAGGSDAGAQPDANAQNGQSQGAEATDVDFEEVKN